MAGDSRFNIFTRPLIPSISNFQRTFWLLRMENAKHRQMSLPAWFCVGPLRIQRLVKDGDNEEVLIATHLIKQWPERVYKAQSPVSAIDFSKTTPNLLAVGYMDGRISIYDVRKNDPKPVLDNR